jgi:hypothetical protein
MRTYDELQTSDSVLRARYTPQKRLVAAVLLQAADDLRLLRERLRAMRFPHPFMVDAVLWVESDDKLPFTFEWCCELIGRDPDATRKKMLQGINVKRLKEVMRV